MEIKDQKEYFDGSYKGWKDVDAEKRRIIGETIHRMNVAKDTAVLDVGAGTGVLYPILEEKKIRRYMAIDISEKMLGELKSSFPLAETACMDFDKPVFCEEKLKGKFNYVILFNSIPHFENLEALFRNVKCFLAEGGIFVIAHGRTRAGLREHHRKIGYDLGRDAIPRDEILMDVASRQGFRELTTEDEDFFYFSCKLGISEEK